MPTYYPQLSPSDRIRFSTELSYINTITDLKNYSIPAENEPDMVYVNCYRSTGDNGGGTFKWDVTSTLAENSGTVFNSNNTANGRWKRIFDDSYVSIDWFGPWKDYTHDDSLTIQNAVNYCQGKGKALIFPRGHYKINSGINIRPEKICIDFCGSTIDASDLSTGAALTICNEGNTWANKYQSIRNVYITGSNANKTGDNCGIMVSCPNANNFTPFTKLYDFTIERFGKGIIHAANAWGNEYNGFSIGYCLTGIDANLSNNNSEAIGFHDGVIHDVGLGFTTVDGAWAFYNTKFDYNKTGIAVVRGGGCLSFFGGHLEDGGSQDICCKTTLGNSYQWQSSMFFYSTSIYLASPRTLPIFSGIANSYGGGIYVTNPVIGTGTNATYSPPSLCTGNAYMSGVIIPNFWR